MNSPQNVVDAFFVATDSLRIIKHRVLCKATIATPTTHKKTYKIPGVDGNRPVVIIVKADLTRTLVS